ncbi:MAG: response regulator transcription factor [bacterium]|nr:response regulator transcription factor [bacterium]
MKDNQFLGSEILLVEDEETLAKGLEYNLTEEGYHVVRAKDGKKALDLVRTKEFDLIILDIMLPYFDGFEVTRLVREKSPEIPILMLTAKTSVDDKIHGLALGADDYMTKPFHLQELLVRVKGMLKRKMWYKKVTTAQPVYRFGDNEINFENLKARSGKQQFQLTTVEAMLLKYLIENKGKIVSRKELLENVWNITSEIETRTVDNFIVRLRKFFEPTPAEPIYFKSIRSAGYMFVGE